MAITCGEIGLRFKWIQKQDVYLRVSLFGLFVLFCTLLSDFFHATFLENTADTSQHYSMALLVLHTLSFYLALLSFIYTTQSASKTRARVALTLWSTFGNLVVFSMRIAFEVTYQNCRQEQYRMVTLSGK